MCYKFPEISPQGSLTFTLLPSATKLRRLCFHRRVSVHMGIWSLGSLVPGGAWFQGGLVLGGAWSRGGVGPGGIPACTEADPPGETATAADGMHPTGMHSCCADMSLYPQSCNSRLFPFLFIDCVVRMSRGCVEISTAVLFVAGHVAVLARPTAGRPLRYTD